MFKNTGCKYTCQVFILVGSENIKMPFICSVTGSQSKRMIEQIGVLMILWQAGQCIDAAQFDSRPFIRCRYDGTGNAYSIYCY